MIKTKMSLAIAALCLIAFVAVGLLVLMTERAHRVQDHIELQYRGLVGFIELDSAIYETFMKAQHEIFAYDDHTHFDQNKAKRDIELRLTSLENTVLAKAEFLNWTETQIESERAILKDLREEVEVAFDELQMARLAASENKIKEARDRAHYVFNVRIEQMFQDMIAQKISSERDRMARAQREIRTFSHMSTSLTLMIAILAIGVSLWAIFTLLWQVQRGLDTLARGTQRLATGDLNHRIEMERNDELGSLASFFNQMAARFQSSQKALKSARNDLEEKVAERTDELNTANEELKARDEMRRQFFADIGHELRTPVTAIRGQAEVALRSKDHHLEHRTEALTKIVSLADQLSQDVSALFFIAREQAGVIDLRREQVDLAETAKTVIGNMSAYFEKEKAIVELSMTEGHQYLVDGTDSRLAQMLSILVMNAIVHSHVGVTVRVSLKHLRDRVNLTVSDNGPGIPLLERQRVFERFYRMENKVDSNVTGTGLGLPIARSLAHAHGGIIRIDESEEGGTKIQVSFPRLQED